MNNKKLDQILLSNSVVAEFYKNYNNDEMFKTELLMNQASVSIEDRKAVKAALADYYKRQGIDPEPIVGKIEDHDHDACHI